MITVDLPLRLVTLTNRRESRFAASHRARTQRQAALLRVANKLLGKTHKAPYMVIITRYGKQKLDSDDNLNDSAKHVRDGIADALGVNDGDTSRIRFVYAQEIAVKYWVRVEIRSADA